MARRKKDALESASDTLSFTDSLLDLFWTVDEVMKGTEYVPTRIMTAYRKAEAARQAMASGETAD